MESTSLKVDHDTHIISIVVVVSSLAVVAVGLRLFSRWLKKLTLQADDYFVVAAWVFLPLSTISDPD